MITNLKIGKRDIIMHYKIELFIFIDISYSNITMSIKINIDKYRSVALSREGKYLPTIIPKNTLSKLDEDMWECKFNHRWKANYNNVRNNGTWCPDCHKNQIS